VRHDRSPRGQTLTHDSGVNTRGAVLCLAIAIKLSRPLLLPCIALALPHREQAARTQKEYKASPFCSSSSATGGPTTILVIVVVVLHVGP
jgi:hypothetical protein